MKRVAVVVLALALVGVIGFAAWKTWDNRQENKNSSSQQTNDPSEGGKYLVIKEWGVRFEIPESQFGDVAYVKSENYDETETLLVKINSINLGNSKCGNEQGEVFGLYREDINISEQTTPGAFKKIDSHNYFLTSCEDYGLNFADTREVEELKQSITGSLEQTN